MAAPGRPCTAWRDEEPWRCGREGGRADGGAVNTAGLRTARPGPSRLRALPSRVHDDSTDRSPFWRARTSLSRLGDTHELQ